MFRVHIRSASKTSASNEYPQHMFPSRNKKNGIIWIHFIDRAMKASSSYEVLVLGQVILSIILVLKVMGQVGQVVHGNSVALVSSNTTPTDIVYFNGLVSILYSPRVFIIYPYSYAFGLLVEY